MKRYYLLGLIFLFVQLSLAQTYTELTKEIEDTYSIEIIYNSEMPDTWGQVSFSDIESDENLASYLKLLKNEMSKYPNDFFSKISLKYITLCKNLAFNGQNRAAIPDPYLGNIYYTIDGVGKNKNTYLIHTFHHELHHYTEYAIWQDMRYDWDAWISLNSEDFTYGDGGETAYANSGFDYYSPQHPRAGFLNLYSMTGDEEDRCEIIAFWLTETEREIIKPIIKQDTILKNKLDIISALLLELSGTQIIDVEK